jgi:hypothetical protein
MDDTEEICDTEGAKSAFFSMRVTRECDTLLCGM